MTDRTRNYVLVWLSSLRRNVGHERCALDPDAFGDHPDGGDDRSLLDDMVSLWRREAGLSLTHHEVRAPR